MAGTTVDHSRVSPSGSPGAPERGWRVATVLLAILLIAALGAIAALVASQEEEPADATPPEDADEPADDTPPPADEPEDPADDAPAADQPDGAADPIVEYGQEPPGNWDVTWVGIGDVLNVRSGPGVSYPIIATLPPYTIDLESTGRIATVEESLWREIKVPGATTGWVNAAFVTETVPQELPLAVLQTVDRIRDAAAGKDWDQLAEIATEGDAPFHATVDQPFTDPSALAAHWRAQAAEEPLADILLALLTLRAWEESTGTNAEDSEVIVHVTPAFMLEPSAANRRALEAALGTELVAQWTAGGEYLGYRVGITDGGDWRFFVAGD